MGGRRPPIAPLRGDSQKALAPRAVAGVKAWWLLQAGVAKSATPAAASHRGCFFLPPCIDLSLEF